MLEGAVAKCDSILLQPLLFLLGDAFFQLVKSSIICSAASRDSAAIPSASSSLSVFGSAEISLSYSSHTRGVPPVVLRNKTILPFFSPTIYSLLIFGVSGTADFSPLAFASIGIFVPCFNLAPDTYPEKVPQKVTMQRAAPAANIKVFFK